MTSTAEAANSVGMERSGMHLNPSDAQSLKERLLECVEYDTNGGCWLWSGYLRRGGYGAMSVGSRPKPVHRVAYEVFVGPITDGLFVCHKCDIPACFNPDHLWLGTHQENMDDKVKKGRQSRVPRRSRFARKGQECGASKLKEEDVLEIRRLAKDGVKQGEIGARFGVGGPNVSMIVNRLTWRHI